MKYFCRTYGFCLSRVRTWRTHSCVPCRHSWRHPNGTPGPGLLLETDAHTLINRLGLAYETPRRTEVGGHNARPAYARLQIFTP